MLASIKVRQTLQSFGCRLTPKRQLGLPIWHQLLERTSKHTGFPMFSRLDTCGCTDQVCSPDGTTSFVRRQNLYKVLQDKFDPKENKILHEKSKMQFFRQSLAQFDEIKGIFFFFSFLKDQVRLLRVGNLGPILRPELKHVKYIQKHP